MHELRLHFGCFNCPQDGWINTDVTPHIFIARVPGLAWLAYRLGKMSEERFREHARGTFRRVRYMNASKHWPYPDNHFSAIFSSHVLEHLPLSAARVCISEGYRCLRVGGIVRLAVPDLDREIARYNPADAMEWAITLFEANERSLKNAHHFMYNFVSLRQMLEEAGFRRVARRAYREGDCPDLGKMDNRPDSLFVEAVKP